MAAPAPTRRELLRRGLAAGTLAGLASPSTAAADTQPSDSELVAGLVGVEMVAALAYQRALAAGLLPPAGVKLGRELLSQEQAHLEAVKAELTRLGGTPPKPLSGVAEADKVLTASRVPALAHVRNAHDWIILLSGVELMLEGFYRDAIMKLRTARAVQLCVEVMATEAQHGVALSELLHPGDVKKAVPSSYVDGRR
jgi:hypothetical protein